MKPTGMENASLGLDMVVGPTEISVIKKNLAQKGGVPVHVDPILMPKTGAGTETLGLNMRVGPDDISVQKKPTKATLLQLGARNPVHNPPFNNWSVNQPAVAHDAGWAAGADFNQDMIVDGHRVHY